MATTQTNKTPVKTSSSDEKAYQNALLNDPRLDCWKKVVLNCCILITILAFQYVLLGLVILMFGYQEKTAYVIFGFLSAIQLVCAPLGYHGIKTGNRLFLMIMAVVNVVWMISTFILLLCAWIFGISGYKEEPALHVGMFVFICASITLLVFSFLLMRRLHMVRLEFSKNPVTLSPDGKLKSQKTTQTAK